MKQIVEYAQTPAKGVTHLISVGEDGAEPLGSVLLKSAAIGVGGALGAGVLLKSRGAPWIGMALFGLALSYYATK
jgi:hypothetical protein